MCPRATENDDVEKTIIVVVRGNMPLQFRYTADPDDFERDETTALEAVKSLEFK